MLNNKRTVQFTVNRHVYDESRSVLASRGSNLTHLLREAMRFMADLPTYKRYLKRYATVIGVQLAEIAFVAMLINDKVRPVPRLSYLALVLIYLAVKGGWLMWTVTNVDVKHLRWFDFV